MYQTIDSQLKKNRTLVKENTFLRETLENFDPAPKSIELEMLSNDETEELLEKILQRASGSASMQRRLKDSEQFMDLCHSFIKSSSRKGWNGDYLK